MPQIKTNEIDATVASIVTETSSIVYVPGMIGAIAAGRISQPSIALDTPTLITSIEQFKLLVGDSPSTPVVTPAVYDTGYMIAYYLLQQGLQVLYEVPSITPVGESKRAVQTKAEIETVLVSDVFWNRLKDIALYDIRFITTGGYCNILPVYTDGEITGTPAFSTMPSKITAIAADRKDCIALIDLDQTITSSSNIRTLLNSEYFGSDDYKYAALFTPWTRFANEWLSVISGISSFMLPGSISYLLAYAASIKTNPDWYAAAGSDRGKVTQAPTVEYGDADIKILQNGEGVMNSPTYNHVTAANPIANIRPYGYLVWGNRTLFPNTDGLVASSFLNIRQIVCDVSKILYKASRKLTFEQNSDILWVNFKAQITPLLDKMKSGNGIAGYTITKEATNVIGQLKATIKIIPIEAVEDFYLTVMLVLPDAEASITE